MGDLLYQYARLRAHARALLRANADLRASEERFRAITEAANDAIISADSAGNIVSWNTRAEAIFGYKVAEILGAPLTRLIPARYQTAHRQRFAQWLADGYPTPVGSFRRDHHPEPGDAGNLSVY
jgi:PAS domain S-box-containing protein